MESWQGQAEESMVDALGWCVSPAEQGHREFQRKRSREEEGAEGQQRGKGAGQGFLFPGLRLLLIISLLFVEAAAGGGSKKGSAEVLESEWCGAQREPQRASQCRTRAIEQPQRRAEDFEPEKETTAQDREDQKENETKEGGLGSLRSDGSAACFEASRQAQRGHASLVTGI